MESNRELEIENNFEIQSHLGNIAYVPMNFWNVSLLEKTYFQDELSTDFSFSKSYGIANFWAT